MMNEEGREKDSKSMLTWRGHSTIHSVLLGIHVCLPLPYRESPGFQQPTLSLAPALLTGPCDNSSLVRIVDSTTSSNCPHPHQHTAYCGPLYCALSVRIPHQQSAATTLYYRLYRLHACPHCARRPAEQPPSPPVPAASPTASSALHQLVTAPSECLTQACSSGRECAGASTVSVSRSLHGCERRKAAWLADRPASMPEVLQAGRRT